MKTFKKYIQETGAFRYRRPSLNRMLGITKLKKEVRQKTGINAIARYKPSRIKQRFLQHIGYYGKNKTMRVVRQLAKGKLPSLLNFIPKG